MKEYFQKIIAQKGLQLSLLLIIILIGINAVLVIYHRQVIIQSSEASVTIQKIRDRLSLIDSHFRQGDIGVRAYIIKQNPQFLLPFNTAKDNYRENLDSLEILLKNSGFDINLMTSAKSAITDYMGTLQLMVDLCDRGNVEEAIDIFLEDRGYDVWQRYSPFLDECTNFTNELQQTSENNYKSSINFILIIQILLILISLPVLLLAYRKIVKDDKFQISLFKHIDESNRDFLYDDGKELAINDEDSIINNLVGNLKKAASFINNITKGNYSIQWEGMEGKVRDLNKASIAGELVMMRDQMQNAKKEDDIRIWTNEGLSKFSDLIRKYQNNLADLSDDLISNIVQYVKAQQGGVFFLNDDNPDDKHLELVGCYAFQRKKFMEKRIELGQGMVGQCFLEEETTYITDIPEDYLSITSGLGDSNPNTLLIIPMRINEDVVGVIEIAKLKAFEKYQIEFLERLAETIAAAITSVKMNEKTQGLLEQSQQQAEEMRAQEEEMRQNMEELQATQEQMHRKNEEVEELLLKASEKEEILKKQNEVMISEKGELETEKAILNTLMELLPERITIKDQQGKFLQLSEAKYRTLREQGYENVIGKSDKDIFGEEHFEKSFAVENELMKSKKPVLNIEEKINISKDVSIWGLTSRVPFLSSEGKVLGTIVMTRDITKEKTCEEELEKLKTDS